MQFFIDWTWGDIALDEVGPGMFSWFHILSLVLMVLFTVAVCKLFATKHSESMDRKVRDWFGRKDRALRKEDALEVCFILGLTVEEAFWAACHASVARHVTYDNRSHLRSSVPRGASGNPTMMTASEMAAAKELFGDLTESEIQILYNKCR